MPQGPYRQTVVGVDLAIEKKTARVPDDGHYYVILDGTKVARYRALAKAQEHFKELKRSLPVRPSTEKTPMRKEDLLRRITESMSNKELVWSPEDHARVERETRGRPKRR